MRTFLQFILVTFAAIPYLVLGNSYVFTVTAMSGTVMIQKSNSPNWQKASYGAKLDKGDAIKVSESAYVTLVHANLKTLALKKAGSYSVVELEKQIPNASSNITTEYVNYVMNQSTQKRSGNNMVNTGSVERAASPTPILPRKAENIIDDEVTFSWATLPGSIEYQFEIADDENNILYNKVLKGTSVTVDIKALNLKTNYCYYWHVSDKRHLSMKSDDICFKTAGNAQRQVILKDVESINQDLGETGAFAYIVLAEMYYKNKVSNRASDAYLKAIELAPDMEEYKTMYVNFMTEIGVPEKLITK